MTSRILSTIFSLDAGDGILRHVLGDKREVVEKRVSQGGSIDIGTISKLFTMLAPLLMGMLGRTKKQSGSDVSGLTGYWGWRDRRPNAGFPGHPIFSLSFSMQTVTVRSQTMSARSGWVCWADSSVEKNNPTKIILALGCSVFVL